MGNLNLGQPLWSTCFLIATIAFGFTTSPTSHAQERPTSAGLPDAELITDLIAANRILADKGILDGFGHVSVRHRLDPKRFLLSRSLAPALVTADDVIEYDLNGVAVDTEGSAEYSERFIHAAIYEARPDINAIVHHHSPSLITFGISSVELRPTYHLAAFIVDRVPVFDIRDALGVTGMLVNDSSRGRALARTLGERPAVLMRGHGTVVVGPTLPVVVARSIYLEVNARIELDAIALGGPVVYLDADEARAVLAEGEHRAYERPWELWKKESSSQ
jgi:ribulose-5-phosphate 4-epimerase/fuculose-1-phosphate aldolase